MKHLTIRLPDSLHQAARELAEQENTSINHLITLALAEKIAALKTLDYLEQRGARGSRAAFEAVLAKVPPADPAPDDRLD